MNSNFFQNMAPNAQRSFLISLVLAVVATVIYLFGVEPAASALAKDRMRLGELQDRERRMATDLKGADTVKKQLEDLAASLEPFEQAMLTPLLESYAMRAKSVLDPLILGAGLVDPEYAEEPFRALPLPKPMPRQLHTRAAIRLTARGSYQAFVSFLQRLEMDLPLVSVQAIDVTAQRDPETQSISAVLEWPAKGGLTRK